MTEVVSSHFDRIVIRDHVSYRDLRPLCWNLHNRIIDAGFKEVTLDFSLCLGITEAVMLPLIPLIAKYQRDDVDFRFIAPTDATLRRLFENANWAYHLDPSRYKLATHEGGHVPALCFGKDGMEDANEIADRIIRLILGQLETDRSALKVVEWSLWEIMDNAVRHAQSPVGGFVQATAYKNTNRVEFIVADAGIGIPQSMGISPDDQALLQAIAEGGTSDKTKGAGNGLYGSHRVALLSNGQFEINSYYGKLFSAGEEVRSIKERVPYAGTSVRCSISLNDRELLSNALEFKGKMHDPPSDYVERKFESDQGGLTFGLYKEAQRDVGSRKGGIRIRRTIENLLREQHSIVIDFLDVGVISSSFADEVFGRLFVKMGPRAFMKQIEMRNVDPVVEGLIDRAIVQRTKLGNGDG